MKETPLLVYMKSMENISQKARRGRIKKRGRSAQEVSVIRLTQVGGGQRHRHHHNGPQLFSNLERKKRMYQAANLVTIESGC